MTGWKRSTHLPARLTHWINTLRAALHCWSWPYRRLHEACLALTEARRRRLPPVHPSLEGLEFRELLSNDLIGQAQSALMDNLDHLYTDAAKIPAVLNNVVQSSPTNRPTPATVANQLNEVDNEVATDLSQAGQSVERLEVALLETYLQAFNALRAHLYEHQAEQNPSLSSSAAGSGSGSGSMSSGHGSDSNQTSSALLSSSDNASAAHKVRVASSPLLSSGSSSGSGGEPTV